MLGFKLNMLVKGATGVNPADTLESLIPVTPFAYMVQLKSQYV